MESMTLKILYNKEVLPGHFRLGLEWKTPRISAGNFLMLRVADGLDPLLRRPLGVYKALGPGGRGGCNGVELFYRVVGRGTKILSLKEPGEHIDVLGPLGNGFPDPGRGKKAVMAAGGMGIVPMYMLAERLTSSTLLFGARSAQETVIADDFKGLACRIKVSTEDGSAGKKGLVTALLKEELTRDSVIYACGPAGMLKAVSRIAHGAGVRAYVSLERAMACGIGVCLGCAVKSKAHGAQENRVYRMVCSDGPVFDSEDIDWELFQ